jgi:hypothetical protein
MLTSISFSPEINNAPIVIKTIADVSIIKKFGVYILLLIYSSNNFAACSTNSVQGRFL